ncbi:MAG: tetratricopeptide repeat protein [Bacteroidota bacterium]
MPDILKLIQNGIFIVLFLSLNTLDAQDRGKIDSLRATLSDTNDSLFLFSCKLLYREYFRTDLDSAGIYARMAFRRSEGSSNPRTEADGNNLLATYFFHTSNLDSALYYFQASQAKFREAKDLTWELNMSSNIALVFNQMGNIEQALEEHMNSLARKESVGMEGEFLASSYWNIGNVLSNLNKKDAAYSYYLKALDIYRGINSEADIIDVEFQIAGILVDKDSLDRAEQLFLKNAEYARKNNQRIALAEVYDWLGDIYNRKQEYQKSEAVLLEAYQIASESESNSLPGQICRRLTDLYMATDQIKKAEKYALLSVENARKMGRGKKIITDFYNLSSIYEQQGDYPLALDYYKQYAQQQDSIFGVDKMNAINKIQTEYEKFKKQQEIELLEEKEKRTKIERNGLIGGIAGLLLLFGSIFYAMRQRMNRNRLAKEKLNQELEFNKKDLEFKKQELLAYALQLAHKNKVLDSIKEDVDELKRGESNPRDVQKIVNAISRNQNDNENWEEFRKRFLSVHKDFEANVMDNYPEVSSNELRLMSLLKMNLSNKEIAYILNISGDGIKKARYRLRKKLGLVTGDSLEAFVLGL